MKRPACMRTPDRAASAPDLARGAAARISVKGPNASASGSARHRPAQVVVLHHLRKGNRRCVISAAQNAICR